MKHENAQDITLKVLYVAKANDDIKRVSAACILGMFQIIKVYDESYDFDVMCGDCYNPDANPDIEVTTLARQKRAFRARVNREGVYGVIVQCRATPNAEWVDVESVWSIVGDEFENSGEYISDFVKYGNNWLFENADLKMVQAALKDLL